MNLWTGIRTRGPTESPCSSTSNARTGTRILPLPPRYNGQRRSRSSSAEEHNPIASASIGARSDGIATESPNLINTRSVKVVWEDTEDDVYVPAPPGGKTLKINVDLMLWRCRQARLKAQLSLDEEERRELLKEAEAGLRRCLVLDPADGRTYVVLGKLYMVQRRFQEARALYAEGVANTGNLNAYIWSAWGWLEFKTGNMPRARQLFDAATLVDSTHACAWHKWGLLEKSEGNYTEARDLWIKGIQRCRTRPQAQNAYLFNALAVMAAELKRVSEARAWFDEGTNSIEGAASVALWQAWAVLEANQGDPEAVRYLFKKAIDANPRSRYVHLAWALWERKLGNLDTCSQLLQRGQAMNATDAALYQARALIEWRDKGNAEAARALFEAGVRADPGHIPLWQAWGCMEAQLGRVDQARELFQQGVWADPRSRDTVWVFHAWGCLERAQDKLQTARELFKAAIKVDPKAEKVWFTWIAMEADAGLLERADELRIRQAEQQWEFEVPAGFTTRPSGGLSATLAAGPLQALKDTLSRFFSVRSAGSGGAAQPALNQPPARPTDPGVDLNSVRSFLPADFTGDLSLQDMLMMVAKRSAGTAADPSGADAAARLLDASLTRPGGQQVLAQANALMSADLGSEEDEMLEASIKPPRAQLQAYAAAVAPSASTDTRAAFPPPIALNGTTAQAAEAAAVPGVDGAVEKRAGKRSRGKRRSAVPAPVVVPAYLKEFATSPQRQPARQSTSNVMLVARPTRPDRSLDEGETQEDRTDHAAEAVVRQPAAVAEPVSDASPPS